MQMGDVVPSGVAVSLTSESTCLSPCTATPQSNKNKSTMQSLLKTN